MIRSKLVKSASIYVVANIINSAFPFFLLPILTRYLTPSDYGIVSTFQVFVTFLSPLIGLSVQGAIARKFPHKDELDFPRFVANGFYVVGVSFLILSSVVLVFVERFEKLTSVPREVIPWVLLGALAQFMVAIVLSVIQFQKKSRLYVSFQIGQTAINFFLSLILVVSLQWSWKGRIIGQLFSSGTFALVGLVYLVREGLVKWQWESKFAKQILWFGVPLIPHNLAGWINGMSDRIFLNRLQDVSQTGVYTVALQLTGLIGLVQLSVNTAWTPWFYEKLKEKKPDVLSKIVRFTYGYVFFNFVGAFAFSFIAPLIIHWVVGPKFWGASEFIFWLTYARAIESLYYMTTGYLFYTGKTTRVAAGMILSSSCHVIAMYTFIQKFGTIGAAYASACSSTITAFVTWFQAARSYKMPWLRPASTH